MTLKIATFANRTKWRCAGRDPSNVSRNFVSISVNGRLSSSFSMLRVTREKWNSYMILRMLRSLIRCEAFPLLKKCSMVPVNYNC